MALTDQPYFPFYVDDYLTDEKLLMCEFSSQGVFARLMCHFHKSSDYGRLILTDFEKAKLKLALKLNESKTKAKNEIGFLEVDQEDFWLYFLKIKKLVTIDGQELISALIDLLGNGVLHLDNGILWQKRMYEDGQKSLHRSNNGKKGGRGKKQNESKTKANPKAKQKLNPVYVNGNGSGDVNGGEKGKGGPGEKGGTAPPKVPDLDEFLDYALEKCPDVNGEEVRLKYESWKANGWRTGGKDPRDIKNWKSTLLNTIPHLSKQGPPPQGKAERAITANELAKEMIRNGADGNA